MSDASTTRETEHSRVEESTAAATSALQGTPPEGRVGLWLAVYTLALRELTRFFRQRTRIVGALAQPIGFWIFFGTGLSGSFRLPGAEGDAVSFQAYFLPGIAAMIVLFTAIFSTISIIEDRREGFLQAVIVSPIPRLALVLGKLLGGSIVAVIQAVVFLALAPLLHGVGLSPDLGLDVGVASAIGIVLFLTVMALSLTGLGYCIAWPIDSTQGYHAIMSIFLFPMWLLSGAFFPAEGSGWLKWIIYVNPLTYGVAGLRHLLYGDDPSTERIASLPVCTLVTVLFCAAMVAIAVALTRRKSIA